MIPRLLCLLFCWNFAVHLGRAQKLPGVKKASLKVQINATSDTVVLKFLRPTPNINLEGFILGYGSSFFSTQYIPLPENGNSYDTELDAEPRYLVAVRPSPIVNAKKTCSAQTKVQKPLQVVVGTLTPTSVYLAWGVLVNPQNDWTVLNKCPTDRFYTVRYREKEKNKKWNFQLCPSTETVVDNLKPNIIYEFGVKDNSDDGTWNKGVTHKTTVPPKHKNGGNGHIQNTYPKGHIQEAPEDTKMLVPVTVIKQVVQNISNGKKPKSTVSSALPTSTTTIERQPGSRNPPEHTNPKKLQGPLAQTESEVEPSKFHVSTTPGLSLTTLAPSSVDQETTGPIISNALQLLGTTLAVNDMQPLPAILATSGVPEIAKATAVNQMSQVPPTTKIYISTEHPESTLVSNELPLFIPTMGTTPRTGKQFTDPVSTESPLSPSWPEPPEESEESELVSNELPLFIPTMGSSARTEKQMTDTVKHQFTQGTFTTLSSTTTKQTKSALVSTEPPFSPSEPEPSEESEIEESELVSHRINPEVLKTVFSLTPERPNSTPAALPKTQEPFKYEKILSTEHSDSETAKLQVSQEPLTKEAFITTDQPDSELASHDITQEPQNAKGFIPEQQTFATLDTMMFPTTMIQVSQEYSAIKTGASTDQPDSALASREMTQEPQRNKMSSPTEQAVSTLEVRQITQEPPTDIPDISPTQPDSTPVSNEPTVLASKQDTASVSEIHQSKPATTKPKTPEVIIPKSQPEEQPKSTLDFNKTPFISSESKVYEKPETPLTDPVRWTSQKPLTPKPSRRFRRPKTTLGPKDSFFISSKLSTSAKPDVLQREPGPRPTQRVPINFIRLHFTEEDPGVTSVPNEIHELPSAKPKAAQTTQRALPTPVSKKTQRVPINLIHLHIFEDPDTTPVPNETSKAKTVHPSERPQSKDVPKSTHRVPINLIRLHIFEDPSVTLVPSETQKTSSKPTSQTTELPHVKADSEDFHTKTTKPKILTARPRPQTTKAPRKVHPSSSRPKTSARPRTRPVPNRTTQATALPKSSNDLNWISETAVGAKLTGQDVTKLLGVSRNTSTEPNGTVKRPISGSSLPPPRPTHMRRRPFPPNNVTGRPGIAGNGLMPRSRSSSSRYMPRPTQVAVMERTQPPQPRTTSAPEKETVTETVFNESPVSDVDPLGKPRYTAPHVKYMRKEDLVPCSITESMRHFPTETGANEDEATIAPQNPPSNLTVVAVEGCPSFVILDWEQPSNDTVTEYKVISKENGGPTGKDQSILTTNQTHSTVENLKPDTSYEFKVIAKNVIGEGPPSTTVTHNTESADPRVSEPITGGKDAIWTEIKFKSDTYSECKGKQYVKRTWYKKFVGIQLCNSLRYKIYLSDSLSGKFYNIGDESGYGEDHCQFVDSFLDGRTGQQLYPDQLPTREGFYRSVRQQPVDFGKIGSQTHIRYVHWYECGTTIPGKW